MLTIAYDCRVAIPHGHRINLALSICVLGASGATAQMASDFRCTIERVEVAGALAPHALQFLRASNVGKEFTVERSTGVMAGVRKMHSTSPPIVVDVGGPENAYKVVATMRRDQGMGFGSNVYALVINTYEAGNRKPFLFTDNSEAYFGSCVPF